MKNILPSAIIEVSNPAQVLFELENIGINIGTIFGDYDSIAKHIKEKENRNHISDTESR